MIVMRELNTNFVNNTPNMASTGAQQQDAPMVATSPPLPSSSALVKRCVIIQKDERGYGLRVSGDNPVFVESVRPDGAAWRAGVRAGDRIIKVNGTLVTKHGHGDVVRMIQNCGSYVGLTLLGLKTSATATSATASVTAAAAPPPQITAPLPPSERTQQEYEASRVATIQEMLKHERQYLQIMTAKKNQMEMDATIKRMRALEATLEKMTLDVQRVHHRHTSMSAENLTTATNSESALNANARKSHSFGQYDTRAPIMTMESDEENDDIANNNNNINRNSSSSSNSNNNSHVSHLVSDIPSTVDSVHAYSLRMAKWLISQQCPPHALLFYTMAGHVFPSLVAASNSRRNLVRWGWQIACTWLVPDSPLAFAEFPSEILTTFDQTIASPNSSLETLFSPFLEHARDILNQQLEAWRSTANIGLVPTPLLSPKEELHSTIELLISTESSPNIEIAIDNMISHAHNNVSTIAVVTSLLTIGQYVFGCPSKHLLLSQQQDTSSPPPPNPVLKLSDHSSSGSSSSSLSSKKQHKRHSSLPARAVSPGHIEAGHHFVQTHDLKRVLYCSGCMLPIWGTFGHMCAHCQMSVHVWCMKSAAINNPCPGPPDNNQSSIETTPTARVIKNRRWKSSRPILDILKKTGLAHTHEQHAPIISSTSSSDDEDVNVTALVNNNTEQSIGRTTPTPPNTIQRSESFRQRRSKLPSYRKRSDPALTTTASNLANFTSDATTATSDNTTGSPVRPTSPDNWLSSSDDEDDQSYAQQNDNNNTGGSIKIDEDTPPPLPPNHPSEKRIQVHNDIMREIIDSEERHVEVLTFIIDVFYRPLRTEQLIPKDQLSLIFSNTKKLLRLHAKIFKMLASFTSQNKTFEQILFDIFCGDLGLQLEKEASVFCANQKTGGIDTWRARRKDSKIKSILLEPAKEIENPLARLSLEDHFGSVFQRPLRYQLLIQRLFDQTPVDSEEFKLLQRALARSKEIGSIVNEATRRAELRQRLLEIQKKIDRAQATTLDLEGHCLVHEGSLTWRITKQKNVDVWLLLTDKLLVILGRDGDRLVFKPHTNPHTKTQHPPTLLLHDLLTRDVATDSTAFFLVSSEQNFFYEFAASTPKDRNAWKEAIANATMTYNGGKSPPQHITKLRDLTIQASEDEVKIKDEEPDEYEEIKDEKQETRDNNLINIVDENESKEASSESTSNANTESPKQQTSRVEGVIRYVRDEECHVPDLISPSSVTVSSESINCEIALSVLSPEQQIAEIDERVSQLLEEKRSIIARMQGINDQWEWSLVCDIAQHDNTSVREVTFFDKAMSVMSTLARDGLTRDTYKPLIGLREQIDALLARLSVVEEQQEDQVNQLQASLFETDPNDDSDPAAAVYF